MEVRAGRLMRLLMVTQWFDPEPAFKGAVFLNALRKRGYEVEVLTGFPNYPGGKLYPGYKVRFLQREEVDGIPVIRVPLYPSHDRSPLRRVANYTSFACSAATIGAAAVRKADVMYVYHPPATVALPAMVIDLIKRVPFIYDVQDLWPDTLRATGMVNSRAALKMVGAWSRLTYSRAARIVVLSPGFKRKLVERGVPEGKIHVIYNWCEENLIRKTPRNEPLARDLGFEGRFNVLFAGSMGKAQGLDAVIEAARRLRDRAPDIRFVFIGAGIEVDRLKRSAGENGLRNVQFLPPRPFSGIGEVLNLADVLLVHLKDDPLFRVTIPSKTQAYLSVGRPILIGVRGDAAELVERAGAGIACTPEDPAAIAEAVLALHDMPRPELDRLGENGHRYYREELSMAVGVSKFDDLFRSVAAGGIR